MAQSSSTEKFSGGTELTGAGIAEFAAKCGKHDRQKQLESEPLVTRRGIHEAMAVVRVLQIIDQRVKGERERSLLESQFNTSTSLAQSTDITN